MAKKAVKRTGAKGKGKKGSPKKGGGKRGGGGAFSPIDNIFSTMRLVSYIDETLAELQEARQRFDSVVVSYSGGKDSLAVMDLCLRTFPRVEAFIMEFVPGLRLNDDALAFAKKRWGVNVRRYLHWITVRAMSEGTYCDNHWKREVPKMVLPDVYQQARQDTGVELIATGAKRSDGIWRRRVMASSKNSVGQVVYPVAGWQKVHVLGYLKLRGIPIPANEGSNANGVDLSVPSLLWLNDNHPDDFKKLLEIFPYAQAVVERRKFYGIPAAKETKRAKETEASDGAAG